jgi:alanyl-tRNA synthetase
MTGHEIRRAFLEYFLANGHAEVASSPVVPAEDPTLLFTNAGMNQFKRVFTGEEHRPYVRAASSQKCIRVSGKHNDLENVGRTPRHHTFFEMLGNFSFGDYFKAEAIAFAWEFLTGKMGLPADRLYATVYEEDDEAAVLWTKVAGLEPGRVYRLGKKDNYWSMGDTGPQGPCSEILWDLAPPAGGKKGRGKGKGSGPSAPIDPTDEARFLEIWNLVFMQFDARPGGEVLPLPRPSIDTGMGLERLAAVLQGTESNFDTDLVRPLVDRVSALSGRTYTGDEAGTSHRVIADHVRALAFAIADGVVPANEGRGYVLRRLLRRAARHGRKLDLHEPFIHRLVPVMVEVFGAAYPELARSADRIALVIRTEEERFGETLDAGIARFEELAEGIEQRREARIGGRDAFTLYDTFGFPLDLTQVMAEERGLEIDSEGFEAAMQEQKERSRADRAAKGVGLDEAALAAAETLPASTGRTFVGYERERWRHRTRVAGLFDPEFTGLERLGQGEEGFLVLDQTPFYAESGGQVADSGEVEGEGFLFQVEQVDRVGGVIFHRGRVGAGVAAAAEVEARIDADRREWIMRNHTATHLMHAALREILGTHVRQAGSRVEAGRLRFDFAHYGALSPEEKVEVDRWVNRAVWADRPVTDRQMPYTEAIEAGALAFFGDKYGDVVRVVDIPGWSTELCGGTHVASTGQIGFFRLEQEGSISSGVRRVEAVTARQAVENTLRERDVLEHLTSVLGGGDAGLLDRVRQMVEENRALKKEQERSATRSGLDAVAAILDRAVAVGGVRVAWGRVEAPDLNTLRVLADALRDKLQRGVGVLGMEQDGKAVLLCVVTDDLVAAGVKAGSIVNDVAAVTGGRGGGKAHLAQAGGPRADKLDEALERVPDVVRPQLPAAGA